MSGQRSKHGAVESMASLCFACGTAALEPHLAVAGEAGPDGLIPTTDRFGTALSDIVLCAACGHMQLEKLPSESELVTAYAKASSEAYVEEEIGERETARRTLDRIERFVERGALLDVGCWVGFLLAEARGRGWETLGVEPSTFASAYARERLNLDVVTGDLNDSSLDEHRFDAIVLGDVLEHLPDPGQALDRLATLLAPTGVVALVLPDAGSRLARAMGARWWSVIPTHVQYFTRASVKTVLERHAFRPLLLATAPKAFSVRYYLDRIGGYSDTTARALVRAAEATGLADHLWAPDFGDRMMVIARRPASGD